MRSFTCICFESDALKPLLWFLKHRDKGSFSLAFSEVPIMHYLAECYPHAPLIFHNKTQLSTLLCCMHKKDLLAFQLRLGRTVTVANYFTDFSIPTLFSQK